MEQSPSTRPSGLPRPSRLPVPSLRTAPSRDNLQASRQSSIAIPRLRGSDSRDTLSSAYSKPRSPSTPNRQSTIASRQRDVSTGSIIHNQAPQQPRKKASQEFLFRKPSRPVMRMEPTHKEETEEQEVFIEDDSPIGEAIQTYDLPPRSSKPRPSLSERTMETLQNIPSSPAIRNRSSSFYRKDSPMRPPSRTASSRPTSSAGSGTSSGNSIPIDFRASTNTFRPPRSSFIGQTPLKRPGTGQSSKSTSTNQDMAPPEISRLPSPSFSASVRGSPSPVKGLALPGVKGGSKTFSGRSMKPRASINGLFRKPSTTNLDQSSDLDRIGFVPKKQSTTFSNSSSEAASTASKSSEATSTFSGGSVDDQSMPARKSSLALRDQIAKAKAAKRAAATKQLSTINSESNEAPIIPSETFDFGLADDPFNQQVRQDGAKGLLQKRIDAARTDGRLNIAAMGFKQIPDEVMNMYNLESIAARNGAWAESVDLTRLIAAGNELEILSDDIFPDVDPRENAGDEDAKGNQFGGLETLDLHENVLIALPIGLRRLELLTSLNLSNNKLNNECFQVISQILSLRDLKIANNGLTGPLDPSLTCLTNLEVLDLQHNTLTSLPEGLADLVRLRVLNLNENKFKSLPFEKLRDMPLIELLAAKNQLTGTLIYAEVDELRHLQILDVTANALTNLDVSGTLRLPALHQLSCSANRLTELPDLESWTSLLTLAADDNNLATIPDGFVNLPKIKNVNFSGNNIKILDDRIGGMDSLDIFRISGNPLREKKFSGMTTEDLKRALKARMEPEEPESQTDGSADFYSAAGTPPLSPRSGSTDWPVKAGGILDRSNTSSHSLNPVTAADIASANSIFILELHHNMFKEIPASIAFFAATLTNLTISHNELTSDTFLKDELGLPALKELNLSSNTFSSLSPLINRLKAPLLTRLDISFNRLTSLPPLKPHFPALHTLLASHNTIRELSPEAVKGLKVLDCSSNDINSLNARIGLLGGPEGLKTLDVSGNRFRVPKYTVLEKGTEATLAWLRDRIPVGEIDEVE
ncbi:related to receptor-like protein kinase 5 precursor [Rhynchosporium agropyri]|uniref:Related to receptor-like protein kinase 5 n=1 Tax=Rhynchosporium agropyri TaxID=914238 RepID=A0A1E1KW84_9HELO|nr:related to receptor-like protein kinase 5 precursor [Rhynchosporium agropyri]